jgi:hypothetical protein
VNVVELYLRVATTLVGIDNYKKISKKKIGKSSWKTLCASLPIDEVDDFSDPDDAEVYEGHSLPGQIPTSPEEAERLKSLLFKTDFYVEKPHDLYTHPGTTENDLGATETRVKAQFLELFKHSAVSSFFAFLPLSFWEAVVQKTNERMRAKKKREISLSELMKFLGILFYMSIVDKGECWRKVNIYIL